MPMLPSVASLFTDLLRWYRTPRDESASLRDLDASVLADIGVHPSEIGSIDAEWSGRSALTRRRIVAGLHHA
jgi:uncharacterized protein YjiS (DUF1127 family)